MATGVACGLQNRHGARSRPGWVRFPHVPAILPLLVVLAPAAWPLGSARVFAQEPEAAVPAQEPPREAGRDTVPPVSAFGALARSLVIPGWGQAEVGRPLRGAVYFALESASLFMVFRAQARLSAAERAEPPDETLVRERRGAREDWIVLAAFWAFLSGLDAWVSARLWDFEAEVEPPPELGGGGGLGAALTIRLPVGSP